MGTVTSRAAGSSQRMQVRPKEKTGWARSEPQHKHLSLQQWGLGNGLKQRGSMF